MKRLLVLLLLISTVFSFAGCKAKKDNENQASKPNSNEYKSADMTVSCIKGPTGIGMAKLMNDNEEKKTANNYTFNVVASADEISGKIVSGEINIASVPTNLAAKLYNKTNGNIKMLAVNTLGTLSIIENGNSVNSIKDLKGKTVYSIGEGSNPEYILRHLLQKNGIEKDVKIQFVATNDELVSSIVSGKAAIAMMPEPAATTVLLKKDTLRRALSVNDEWEKVSNGNLIMGCVVALSSYVKENKTAVNKFLEEYEKSIDYALKNQAEAASLCEKHEIIPSAAVAQKAIPDCNITFEYGKKAEKEIKDYFDVLLTFDKETLGGKIPESEFYYEK